MSLVQTSFVLEVGVAGTVVVRPVMALKLQQVGAVASCHRVVARLSEFMLAQAISILLLSHRPCVIHPQPLTAGMIMHSIEM